MRKLCALALIFLLLFAACSNGGESSLPDNHSDSQNEASTISREAKPSSPTSSQTAAEQSIPAEESPAEPALQTVQLTVPEGYTLARIGMTLEELGICTADEFIHAAQTGDYSSFPLVAAQTENSNRCFKLEGYLFPDTYEIYTTDSPDTIIRRMLEHLENKIDAKLRAEIEASGYTVDEILTLASIIEKESFGPEPMPLISSVLHNRLNNGMPLQCDVTITYVEGAIKPFISGDINRYNEYYNTFKCAALPAGAICNPGMQSIRAALEPAESDYLFFVTDADKQYLFAETYEEHLANVDAAGIVIPE